jgi:hypothetical protein
MCTVTFSPRPRGYALAMNRDESRRRAPGLPPSETTRHGRRILSPSEPGGGTWIAVNDTGVTFALINWYAVPAPENSKPVSRGRVVNAVSPATLPVPAQSRLGQLPLKQIKPFRLIGIFPAAREIIEWRWDGRQLVARPARWKLQQWISSGLDEPTAQRLRGSTFRRALPQKSAGTLDWLRRLHRSHGPLAGPFSTCMHRADAATVSYTEVAVAPGRVTLRYHAGAPCDDTQPRVVARLGRPKNL